MNDIKTKLIKEIDNLKANVNKISNLLDDPKDAFKFGIEYQAWYTKAMAVVKLLGLDRLDEFNNLYLSDPKRKAITVVEYAIQDYIRGIRPANNRYGESPFETNSVTKQRFWNQAQILLSLSSRSESILWNIESSNHAELLDYELSEARKLLSVNLRGSGTVAGVVLESYLKKVMESRNIKLRKKSPSISDYNDTLKKEKVYDTPTWRKIQLLGDVRNYCTHKKEREPTKEEVTDMISGVNAIIKSVF